MKKKLWLILLVLGLLPFIILLVGGIYYSIVGFAPLYWSYVHYGFSAFMNFILLWSYVYWPTYIVGIGFIVMAFVIKSL